MAKAKKGDSKQQARTQPAALRESLLRGPEEGKKGRKRKLLA